MKLIKVKKLKGDDCAKIHATQTLHQSTLTGLFAFFSLINFAV